MDDSGDQELMLLALRSLAHPSVYVLPHIRSTSQDIHDFFTACHAFKDSARVRLEN